MSRFVRATVLLLLVLGSAGTYASQAWRHAHAPTSADLERIPARLARIPLEVQDPAFVGTRDTLEPRIVELSGAQHYAAVDYRGEAGAYVRLHVGVNTHSDGWLHEPTVCLPSQGWIDSGTELVPMWPRLRGVEPGTRIWRMTLAKGGERLLVYYWFQWGEHIVTTRFERAWRRFRGLLAGERDRPLQIVILYTPIQTGDEGAEERVESLVRALWPGLSAVLSSGD